jgi:hypothetical protein
MGNLMAKNIKFLLIFGLLMALTLSVSCRELPKFKLPTPSVSYSTLDETQEKPSDEEYSILLVQWSLTKELPLDRNMWKVLKYGIGYVVNYADIGFWYVENEVVYNLNDIASQYCENNKQYLGIKWGKLFGIATAESEEEKPPETTAAETTIQEETTGTTIQEETTETTVNTVSSVFKFFNINTLPGIWGNKIRIVEPAVVSFSGVVFGPHGSEIQITGNITGSSYIQYCLKPDSGIYIKVSAVIVDKNGNVNWQQDGYLSGEGQGNAYIKAGEVKNFQLTNSYISPVNAGDKLIIIAYIQGGMPEDYATANNNIDKCIYGSFTAAVYGTTTTDTAVTTETTDETTAATTPGTTIDTTPETNPTE